MTDLIACLGAGKGTWETVLELCMFESFENVFLITAESGKEKFIRNHSSAFLRQPSFVTVNPDAPLSELTEQIRKALEGKLNGLEVALNLTSGKGREHMAVISAILKLGFAIRLVDAQKGDLLDL
mgnify:CR=1 FL=1